MGAAGLAIVIVMLTAAGQTKAAVYEVHACRLPDGRPAPAFGWSVNAIAITSNDCPGGTFRLRTPPGTYNPGSRFGFSFTAPPGTTITGFHREVQGTINQVAGGPPPWEWEYGE